ncbi:shikimate kinase [Propionibacteriaceae bacterium Y2011]|uniref:shikimate kinase n=1 Tax=Microlunatus sp. Y2014 TaxID=3418488 RepID=UPI003B470D43
MTGDVYDPFAHGEDRAPNLLSHADAHMLSADAAHMLPVERAEMVDPDAAEVVRPEDAVVVDPASARNVVTEQAQRDDAGVDLRSAETLAVIGAPGSGKSTVGALVAELLGARFCDVDKVIEEQAGKPISEIFADDGEPAFRRLEEEATVAALEHDQVVALGGGAVMSPKIRAALAGVPVVWLEVRGATAVSRAGLNQARPLLMGNVRGTLIKLLNERTPLYQQLATVTVPNDGDDPAEAARRVVAALAEQA